MMDGLFRFMGKNGSLGYQTGQIYHLSISYRTIFPGSDQEPYIEAPMACPYDSWEKFFENWERV